MNEIPTKRFKVYIDGTPCLTSKMGYLAPEIFETVGDAEAIERAYAQHYVNFPDKSLYTAKEVENVNN